MSECTVDIIKMNLGEVFSLNKGSTDNHYSFMPPPTAHQAPYLDSTPLQLVSSGKDFAALTALPPSILLLPTYSPCLHII